MSRRRSRKTDNKNKINPALLLRISQQLIFKRQLELTDKLLNRLVVSSKDAGFVNAENLFIGYSKQFSRFYLQFNDAIDSKLEALTELAEISQN